MKVIDVYQQYFAAECVFNGVPRRAASVWLTAESNCGEIRYEVGVSFFPHTEEDDFAVSYDACALREIYHAKGRRAKKREEEFLEELPAAADEAAKTLGGTIDWQHPLREARRG